MKRKNSKKSDHGRGFKRSGKQWENSVGDHIGKFIDRMTTSDVLNLIIFSAGTYATYRGIKAAAGVTEIIPEWLKWLSPLSPFLYQLVVPTEIAKSMNETDRIITAIIGGYSMVKLAPLVVQTIGQAVVPTV